MLNKLLNLAKQLTNYLSPQYRYKRLSVAKQIARSEASRQNIPFFQSEASLRLAIFNEKLTNHWSISP
jgi:hypothetical protein